MRYPRTAAAIKRRMDKRHWSLYDLADALEFDVGATRRIVEGVMMSRPIAQRLAEVFPSKRCDVVYWLGLEDS